MVKFLVRTCSARNLKPVVGSIHSYVSPKIGLKSESNVIEGVSARRDQYEQS
jgi:hypothetical protein